MEYVAALDLGTSKMLAVVANKDNRQEIIASAEVESEGIRRGLIYNPEKVSGKLASLLSKISFKPGLKKIYVGIGGQSLHTKEYSFQQEIDGEITSDIINDLVNEGWYCPVEPFKVIKIVSHEYYLDGHLDPSPVGSKCKTIEAKFQLVLGRSSMENDLNELVQKTGIELAEGIVSPIATAEYVLTDKEKDLGCALIEFGAGITYFSVYKGGLLRYLATIPLGGNVITKDIRDLSLTEQEAEERKIAEGNVFVENEEDELNQIIEARIAEIIANIKEQLKLSGYESALSAGIVITGGGSSLKNLDKLLEQKTGKNVRKASGDPARSCALGLIKLAKVNCAVETPKSEPKQSDLGGEFQQQVTVKKPISSPKPDKESIFTKIKKGAKATTEKMSNDLFGGYDNNTEQK